MDREAGRFTVLLAEDDPVSREFLCDAIAACGGEPTACADGPAALALARGASWNLLVLDHHLPGCNGDAVLSALRLDRDGACSRVPAIATTAEPEGAAVVLLRAGFADVLPKPVALPTLRAALARYGCRVPMLDDRRALDACGSEQAVAHLRRIFAEQELPRIQAAMDRNRSADDRRDLLPLLHRLRAACGFCGTTALARAADTLHRALSADQDTASVRAALQEFRTAMRETRSALDARPGRND